MSQGPDIFVDIEQEVTTVIVEAEKVVDVETYSSPGVIVVAAGNVGPPGPPGKWLALTQSEYDALTPPDPDTLYVIIQ